MASGRLCLVLLGFFPVFSSGQWVYPDAERGPFCMPRSDRPERLCCLGRKDNCSLPRGLGLMETRCYCDVFCRKTNPRRELQDCCPDYGQACEGEPPVPVIKRRCYYNGRYYGAEEVFMDNCNDCKCADMGNHMEVMCTKYKCMIDQGKIDTLNRQRRGWTAGNITNFWGKRLDAGYEGMLGTHYSSKKVRNMYAIRSSVRKADLPVSFDWRRRGFVAPIENQNFCNASWSYSIVSTFSDRLAKWSNGAERGPMSYQQHRTCVRGQQQRLTPCHAGYLTKAWKYLMNTGLTTQSCYPESPNMRCEITERRLKMKTVVNCPTGGQEKLYKASSMSRISGEAPIMKEILDAGPVIATVRVFDEFFTYQSGVYDCPTQDAKRGRLHSVKLIGWGEEYVNGRLTPYWIAANSWGTDWGENGFFRIRKGRNDCDIEEFILSFYMNPKRLKRNPRFANFTLDLTDDQVFP